MLGVSFPASYSMPPPGCTAVQHGDQEFQMLQESYMEYASALRDPCFETSKNRIVCLSEQLQTKGVYGNVALQLLQKYSTQINWQGMSQEVFGSFYRFVYFMCREPGKRNVQVSTAVGAWRSVLNGRFRLLDRWCTYVSTSHKANVVLEDTWRQVLDFSRTVHEDLSNYDPASAWPVLLDEFVEHIKSGRRHSQRVPPLAVEQLDFLGPFGSRSMTAVSPRSGSKRRPPDVHEVADQLQQLPLVEAAQSSMLAAGSGIITSPRSQRVTLVAKRLRLDGQQALSAAQDGSSTGGIDAQDFAASFSPGRADGNVLRHNSHRRSVGSAGGTALSAFEQLGQQQQSQQQRQYGSSLIESPAAINPMMQQQHRMPAPAGLALRESGITSTAAAQYSQQQQGITAGHNSCSMDMCVDSSMQNQPRPDRMHMQQQQQLPVSCMPGQHQHAAAQLPPCPSPGHVHPQQQMLYNSGRSEAELRRTNSVIAMMQVTVTEALGFN